MVQMELFVELCLKTFHNDGSLLLRDLRGYWPSPWCLIRHAHFDTFSVVTSGVKVIDGSFCER